MRDTETPQGPCGNPPGIGNQVMERLQEGQQSCGSVPLETGVNIHDGHRLKSLNQDSLTLDGRQIHKGVFMLQVLQEYLEPQNTAVM